MAGPYFTGDAAPVVAALDVASLRSVESNLFLDAAVSRILGTGTYEWDSSSTAVDDGTTVIKPDDILPGDPGRWLLIPDQGVTGTGIDNRVVRWDGTGTAVVQNSTVTLDDTGTFWAVETIITAAADFALLSENTPADTAGWEIYVSASKAGDMAGSTPRLGGDIGLACGGGGDANGSYAASTGGRASIYGGGGGNNDGTGAGGDGGDVRLIPGDGANPFGGGTPGVGGSSWVVGGWGFDQGGDSRIQGGFGNVADGFVIIGDAVTQAVRLGSSSCPVELRGDTYILDPSAGNTAFLDMTDGDSAAVSAASHGRLRYNESAQEFQQSTNGTAWRGLGISGTGTDNHFTRWDGTGALQDSLGIIDDLGRVSGFRQITFQETSATLTPAYPTSSDVAGYRITLQGGDASTQTGSTERKGGKAWVLGGSGPWGGAIAFKIGDGGDVEVEGGYGGFNTDSGDAGDGGDVYVMGGDKGLAGLGADGLYGAVYLGTLNTRLIDIGDDGIPTTIWGELYSRDLSGQAAFLDMTEGQNAPTSGAGHGRLRYNATLNRFEKSENGGAWEAIAGTSGTGTDNHLVRWDGASDIQDSVAVVDDAGLLSEITGITFPNTGNVTVQVETTVGAVVGRGLYLKSGSAGSTTFGGYGDFAAGTGGDSGTSAKAGSGGRMSIYGGTGGANTSTGDGGTGGAARVLGGDGGTAASGTAGKGGAVYVAGGYSEDTGGDAYIYAGWGDVTHGVLYLGPDSADHIEIGAAAIPTTVYGDLYASVTAAVGATAMSGSEAFRVVGDTLIAGDLDIDYATSRWIQMVNTPSETAGGWINIKGGNGSTSTIASRNGGTVNVIGGDGGDSSGWDGGAGGAAVLYGGAAGDTTHATRPGGIGGDVTVGAGQGGDATGSGAGGDGGNVSVAGGSGKNPTGTGARGDGGTVNVGGGSGLLGGPVNVSGGYGNDTGDGGAVNVYGGRALGSGSHGSVNIGAIYTTAVNLGAAGIPTYIVGDAAVGGTAMSTYAPSSEVLHVVGDAAIDGDIYFQPGATHYVLVQQATSGGGNFLVLRGGAAATGSGSFGGQGQLAGGTGGSSTTAAGGGGGGANVFGGVGGSTTAASLAGGDGGFAFLSGGTGGDSTNGGAGGVGGDAGVYGGSGKLPTAGGGARGAGGVVEVIGGDGLVGGAVDITGGYTYDTTGAGADVNITGGGAATGGASVGGSVVLEAGAGDTNGYIRHKSATALENQLLWDHGGTAIILGSVKPTVPGTSGPNLIIRKAGGADADASNDGAPSGGIRIVPAGWLTGQGTASRPSSPGVYIDIFGGNAGADNGGPGNNGGQVEIRPGAGTGTAGVNGYVGIKDASGTYFWLYASDGGVTMVTNDTAVADATAAAWQATGGAATGGGTNVAGGTCVLRGGAANAASATNRYGGNVFAYGGQGASAAEDGGIYECGHTFQVRNRTESITALSLWPDDDYASMGVKSWYIEAGGDFQMGWVNPMASGTNQDAWNCTYYAQGNNNTGAYRGGDFYNYAGNAAGTGRGGHYTAAAGNSTSGAGGDATLYAGSGATLGGGITAIAGDCSAATTVAGGVVILAGQNTTSGNDWDGNMALGAHNVSIQNRDGAQRFTVYCEENQAWFYVNNVFFDPDLGDVYIRPADQTTTSDGYDLHLFGQSNTNGTSGDGGNAYLKGGNSTSGAGGEARIEAGAGSVPANDGIVDIRGARMVMSTLASVGIAEFTTTYTYLPKDIKILGTATAPKWYQESRAGAAETLLVEAQSSTGSTGGNLDLDAGTGTTNGNVNVGPTNAVEVNIGKSGGKAGFLGATAITRPTVSGARDDTEAALANLLTALANLGLITDSTTAT